MNREHVCACVYVCFIFGSRSSLFEFHVSVLKFRTHTLKKHNVIFLYDFFLSFVCMCLYVLFVRILLLLLPILSVHTLQREKMSIQYLIVLVLLLLLLGAIVPLLCTTTNRLLSVYICPCLVLYGLMLSPSLAVYSTPSSICVKILCENLKVEEVSMRMRT